MNIKTELSKKLGLFSAMFVVFASMIGSGIFGTSGEILKLVNSPFLTISLWFFYGLVALAGALSYAELAAMMPHVGGEYVYIREIFGKLPAFLSGWVSFIVGFAAPAAASAFLSAEYTNELLKIIAPNSTAAVFFSNADGQKVFAIFLIIMFSLIHILSVENGGYIQNFLTILKLFIVFAFIFGGMLVILNNPEANVNSFTDTGSPSVNGIGPGMLLVLYAYSGWNGATYIAGEIKNPEKNVPRALFWGTFLTMIIYVLINILYFLAIPADELSGKHTVAAMTASRLFGTEISTIFNFAFCLILLSSISAQVMIGPRVYYAMAKDKTFFKLAGRIHPRFHTPVYSIIAQSILSIIYIISGTFYTILIYMGFALSIFPVITLLGLIKHRYKAGRYENPNLYKTKFFPLLQIFFILVSLYLMVFSFIENWKSCVSAILVILGGIPIYYIWQARLSRQKLLTSLLKLTGYFLLI